MRKNVQFIFLDVNYFVAVWILNSESLRSALSNVSAINIMHFFYNISDECWYKKRTKTDENCTPL